MDTDGLTLQPGICMSPRAANRLLGGFLIQNPCVSVCIRGAFSDSSFPRSETVKVFWLINAAKKLTA